MPGFVGTLVVLAVVGVLVGLALRSVIKEKKSGKGCGCGCSGCTKSCGVMSERAHERGEIREKMKK